MKGYWKNAKKRLDPDTVRAIRKRWMETRNERAVSEEYGVGVRNIRRILRGEVYADVTEIGPDGVEKAYVPPIKWRHGLGCMNSEERAAAHKQTVESQTKRGVENEGNRRFRMQVFVVPIMRKTNIREKPDPYDGWKWKGF